MADDDITGSVTAPELWRRVLEAQRRTIRTATVGRIQTYRRTGDGRNTADVELPIRPGGEEQPVLSHAPVLMMGGGDGYLIFPFTEGDPGLVMFCDTEIGTWRQSGDVGEPADDARLGASGPVMIPGVRPVDETLDAPAGVTALCGSDVRLGSITATKAAVHEDLLSDLDSLLGALDTWGQAVQVATGVPWAGPQVPLLALRAKITAGSYQSSTVKVES